jgi:hypothetical protein
MHGHCAAAVRFYMSLVFVHVQVIRHTVPLCMEQYRRMFGTTRIPGKDMDTLGVCLMTVIPPLPFPRRARETRVVSPPAVHYGRDSKHCVVMSNGMFFVLRLYTHLGHPLHAFEIEAYVEWRTMSKCLCKAFVGFLDSGCTSVDNTWLCCNISSGRCVKQPPSSSQAA